jgi:hypothetical protein
MNPFALVRCYNTDADEYDERQMRRWQLWWSRLFGNAFAKCWREAEPDAGTWEQVKERLGL